jgi:Na+/proline symporter
MIAAGLLTAVMITLQPERLKAPAWLAYLAALAFILAGCISLARAYQRPRLADGIVCLLLAAFTAIELWIAFGPGARHCMGRAVILGFPTSELSCRGVFAIGAVIVGVMLVVALRGLVRQRSAS